MASPEHEGPLELIRARLDLVATLLERVGVVLPANVHPRTDASDFTSLAHYRPDLPIVYENPDGEPALAFVVEMQRNIDDDKPFVWPLYAAFLRARHRCEANVLVIAPDEGIARWARQPIRQAHPTSVFAPLVVGPDEIPTIVTVEEARTAPELAVLSAMAHWRQFPDRLEPVVAALGAADELEDERKKLYSHLVVAVLTRAAREVLRSIMPPQTAFIAEWDREIFDEGHKQGLAKGTQEGLAKGRQEGLDVARKALFAMLRVRGIDLTEVDRARVLACTEVTKLEAWLARTDTATTATEVFG